MITEEQLKSVENLVHSITHRYNVLGYDQEDLFQECMTELWNVREFYNDEYSLTTFTYAVCTNHLSTLARRETNQTRVNHIGGKIKPNIKIDRYDFFDLFPSDINIYNEKQIYALYKAFNMLEKYEYKDDVYSYLRGETMGSIGNRRGVSRQIISRRYLDFIKRVKKEMK